MLSCSGFEKCNYIVLLEIILAWSFSNYLMRHPWQIVTRKDSRNVQGKHSKQMRGCDYSHLAGIHQTSAGMQCVGLGPPYK